VTAESSHKKGERFQRAVKRWICGRPFLGLETGPCGDAYDATRVAASIGGTQFDFSLQLLRRNEVALILYAECKYRHPRSGEVNSALLEFIEKAFKALAEASANSEDTADEARFCFFASLPPTQWREYLRDRRAYCTRILSARGTAADPALIERLAKRLQYRVHGLARS
jgi:hypothetical protein